MFQAFYVIQRLDTGEFVGSDDGEMVYYISLGKARLFQSLQNALDCARDIDPSLMDVTVHTVYQPCNYQSAIL